MSPSGMQGRSRPRRHLAKGMAVAVALVLALAGCGSGSGGDGGGGESGGEEAGGSTTLTVSVWNLAETPEFQALFDAFEAANPDVTIEPVDILADDYPDKVTTMLAGGDSTDVITMKNVIGYARYASRGQLQDITGMVESIDTENLAGLDAFDRDGSYFALPYRQDFWLLYYNKEIFDAAGVDYPDHVTWEEYADIAEQLTSGEGGEKVYGTYHHVWRSVIQAISAAQTGGDQLGGDYGFFTDQYAMALGLQESGATLDFGTAITQEANYRTMFETEAAAMLPMGTWYISGILAANASGDADVDWGLAPMPQVSDPGTTLTFGSPTAFAVNANAENPDVAAGFVEFAAGPEGAAAIAEVGVVPALQSPEITEAYFALEGMPEDELSSQAFEPDSVALEMPVSDITSDVDVILNEEHELIMVGDKTIEEGIQSMGERFSSEVRQ